MLTRTSSPNLTLDEWCRRAVGVPFLEDGRDYDAWDCWGLVMCAYRDVLGIELPDYGPNGKHTPRALARQFTNRNCSFATPCDYQPMAVACIYRRGHVIHAGLALPGRRIMHVEDGVNTCHQPVSHFRVEGYYVPASCGAAPV